MSMRGNVRTGSIADLIYDKTRLTLKAYCELRGLSRAALYHEYVSKKASRALKKDGISIEPTKNIKRVA